MVLKWFKGPHFELQTKVQIFKESISNFYKDYDNAIGFQLKVPHLM